MYVCLLQSDEEGSQEKAGEDGQQKFIAHVPVPSQQEVGWMLCPVEPFLQLGSPSWVFLVLPFDHAAFDPDRVALIMYTDGGGIHEGQDPLDRTDSMSFD